MARGYSYLDEAIELDCAPGHRGFEADGGQPTPITLRHQTSLATSGLRRASLELAADLDALAPARMVSIRDADYEPLAHQAELHPVLPVTRLQTVFTWIDDEPSTSELEAEPPEHVLAGTLRLDQPSAIESVEPASRMAAALDPGPSPLIASTRGLCTSKIQLAQAGLLPGDLPDAVDQPFGFRAIPSEPLACAPKPPVWAVAALSAATESAPLAGLQPLEPRACVPWLAHATLEACELAFAPQPYVERLPSPEVTLRVPEGELEPADVSGPIDASPCNRLHAECLAFASTVAVPGRTHRIAVAALAEEDGLFDEEVCGQDAGPAAYSGLAGAIEFGLAPSLPRIGREMPRPAESPVFDARYVLHHRTPPPSQPALMARTVIGSEFGDLHEVLAPGGEALPRSLAGALAALGMRNTQLPKLRAPAAPLPPRRFSAMPSAAAGVYVPHLHCHPFRPRVLQAEPTTCG